MPDKIPPELSAAMQGDDQSWRAFMATQNLPGGYGRPFDPGTPSTYFNPSQALQQFGLVGSLTGQALQAGMMRYAPQYTGLRSMQGGAIGQMSYDAGRELAFGGLQQYATGETQRYYEGALQRFGPSVSAKASEFIGQSKFAGALMYGGAINNNALSNIYQSGATVQNRFSPTAYEAQRQYEAFTSLYGVYSPTGRPESIAASTYGMNNNQLAGVYSAVQQLQRSGGAFQQQGQRVWDEAATRLGTKDVATIQKDLTSRGFNINRLGATAESQLIGLGAQAAGVDQYAQAVSGLRAVGAQGSEGELFEQMSNMFNIDKLDKNKMLKAASDVADITAATGQTFEELKGLFTAIGSFRGVGLGAKLQAGKSFGGVMSLLKGGAASLSAQDTAAIEDMTSGLKMDVEGSDYALMYRTMTAGAGGAIVSGADFRASLGMSREALTKQYGAEYASMVQQHRQGNSQGIRDIAEAENVLREADMAEYDTATPARKQEIEKRWGATVSVVGGRIQSNRGLMRSAVGASRELDATGAVLDAMMDDKTLEEMRESTGAKNLTKQQAIEVMGQAHANLSDSALEGALLAMGALAPGETMKKGAAARGRLTLLRRAGDLGYSSAEYQKQLGASARRGLVASLDESNKVLDGTGAAGDRARARGQQYSGDSAIEALKRELGDINPTDETRATAIQGVLARLGKLQGTDSQIIQSAMAGKTSGESKQLVNDLLEYQKIQTQYDQDSIAAAKGDAGAKQRVAESSGALTTARAKLAQSGGEELAAALERQEQAGQSTNGTAPARQDAGGPLRLEGTLTVIDGKGTLSAGGTWK